LLITSLSGCSLEQKLPSFVTDNPDRTRLVTPFFTSAIPGLRSTLECPNLISSNSFAHRLGTRNFALQLAPGLVGLKPELRHGRMDVMNLYIRLFSHDTHWYHTKIRNNHGSLKIDCLLLQAFHSFQNNPEIFMLYKDICRYPLGECHCLKFQKTALG
jgi:hypothetical protein